MMVDTLSNNAQSAAVLRRHSARGDVAIPLVL